AVRQPAWCPGAVTAPVQRDDWQMKCTQEALRIAARQGWEYGRQMTGQLMLQSFRTAVLVFIVSTSCAAADRLQEGRVAIIDISQSLLADSEGRPIRPIFEDLHKSGVLVIGRYFSRCQQYRDGKLWRKRLVDGDPNRSDGEAEAILQNGFAIM